MKVLLLFMAAAGLALASPQERSPSVPGLTTRPAHRAAASLPDRTSWTPLLPAHVLPALTSDQIRELSRPPRHTRMGVVRPLPTRLTATGIWQSDGEGRRLWRLRLKCEGAVGLRVHFENFDVQDGSVWVWAPERGPEQVIGPFSAGGPMNNGRFWTVLLAGDNIEFVYAPGTATTASIPFTVPEVFHYWAGRADAAASSYGCFLDETCFDQRSDIQKGAQATALLILGDRACTGVLLNDKNGTHTPFLLTAGHCVQQTSDAEILLAVFGYKTSKCFDYSTATDPPSFDFLDPNKQASGAILLAEEFRQGSPANPNSVDLSAPDFAFVRLNELPAVAVHMAGWSVKILPGDTVTSVSHAQVLPDVVAFGGVILAPTSYFYGVSWAKGTTDRGSSGAGVFDQDGNLVGVDSNGPLPSDPSATECSLANHLVNFTRFSVIYPFIEPWLEDTVTFPPAPGFTRDRITNAASFASGLTPGGLVALFGTNLTAAKGVVAAHGFPLPTELAGTHVEVSGYKAPLLAVANVNGQQQINFQVPWEVETTFFPSVTVTNSNGGVATRGSLTLLPAQPGIFTDAQGYAAALHGLSDRPVTAAEAAAPGEVIALFATGLGDVDHAQPTGQAAGSAPLAHTLVVPQVTIAGAAAQVRFSGLAPGFAGLYQVNVVVPPDAAAGDLPVVISEFGTSSNSAKLTVR